MNKLDDKYLEIIDYFDGRSFDSDLFENEICLREFESCTPNIKIAQKLLNLHNQANYDIKHCYCVHKFHSCLNKSLSINALKIATVYFNYLKRKCFNYEFRKSCIFSIMNNCLLEGDFKCQIMLKDI